MFVQGIKRRLGYECVYVCVIIKQISWTHLLVCVCVCNRSAIKEAPRDVCVCVCTHVRSRVGMGVCLSSSLSRRQLLVSVCICMITPLNDYDYIRQYFTVNYEVLCIKNGTVFPYNYTMQPSQKLTQRKKKSSALN